MNVLPPRISVVLVGLLIATVASAQTYDLAADWVEGPNPNGVWSYRKGVALLGHVAAWSGATFPFPQPAYANAALGAGHIPAAMKLLSITSGFDAQAGDVMMHSWDAANGGALGQGSIVWTAPAAGIVDLAGTAWMARNIGRANDWALLHNGIQMTSCINALYSGDLYSRANPFPFYAGSGGAAALHNVGVAAGDTIALVIVKSPGSLYGDFLCVNWAISYVGPVAATLMVGTGCGGSYAPSLSTSPPIIGGPSALAIGGATPNKAGAIYSSGIPAGPVAIGAGCIVYLDLPTATQLLAFTTTASGNWSLNFQIPFAPPLAGVAVVLQAVVYPTDGPLGFELSNGLYALVGY